MIMWPYKQDMDIYYIDFADTWNVSRPIINIFFLKLLKIYYNKHHNCGGDKEISLKIYYNLTMQFSEKYVM